VLTQDVSASTLRCPGITLDAAVLQAAHASDPAVTDWIAALPPSFAPGSARASMHGSTGIGQGYGGHRGREVWATAVRVYRAYQALSVARKRMLQSGSVCCRLRASRQDGALALALVSAARERFGWCWICEGVEMEEEARGRGEADESARTSGVCAKCGADCVDGESERRGAGDPLEFRAISRMIGDGNDGECEYAFVRSKSVHCEVGGGADVDGQGDSGGRIDALLGVVDGGSARYADAARGGGGKGGESGEMGVREEGTEETGDEGVSVWVGTQCERVKRMVVREADWEAAMGSGCRGATSAAPRPAGMGGGTQGEGEGEGEGKGEGEWEGEGGEGGVWQRQSTRRVTPLDGRAPGAAMLPEGGCWREVKVGAGRGGRVSKTVTYTWGFSADGNPLCKWCMGDLGCRFFNEGARLAEVCRERKGCGFRVW
jgi:hypothetical protein